MDPISEVSYSVKEMLHDIAKDITSIQTRLTSLERNEAIRAASAKSSRWMVGTFSTLAGGSIVWIVERIVTGR